MPHTRPTKNTIKIGTSNPELRKLDSVAAFGLANLCTYVNPRKNDILYYYDNNQQWTHTSLEDCVELNRQILRQSITLELIRPKKFRGRNSG